MAPLCLVWKAKAPQLEQLKFPSRSSIREFEFLTLASFLQGQSSAQDLVVVNDFKETFFSITVVGLASIECLPDDKAMAATFYTCLASMSGQKLLSSANSELTAPLFWIN